MSPAMRHRIGLLRRRLLGRQGELPSLAASDAESKPFRAWADGSAAGTSDDRIARVDLDPCAQAADGDNRPAEISLWLSDDSVVVFYSVIDWHFRHQRPQQLALSLAQRGFVVLYISVNFVNDPQSGFRLERLSERLALYQIFLHVSGQHSVYENIASEAILRQQKIGQRMMWEYFGIRDAIHIVQHPYWTKLASSVAASKLVYDCMDFHAGFSNTSQAHHEGELKLIQQADLTIVSSDYLFKMAQGAGAKALSLIRNATEYPHFRQAYVRAPDGAAKIIGYYGAIAEWFDVGLVRTIATAFPDVEIRLIGSDTVNAQSQLKDLRNVRFLGEIPYRRLPEQLAAFSVCIIPFRITELTLATNPVKVYEYLSAGKPVVAVDLPELRSMDHLISRCLSAQEFVEAVQGALEEVDPQRQQARMQFAAEQTWEQRATELILALGDSSIEPLVSVVIVTYNNMALTERCLSSLSDSVRQGQYSVPIELILIDNASSDGSVEMLLRWENLPIGPPSPVRAKKLVLNTVNRGFGPAVNQGLAMASGDFFVILNNDTIVTTGWARGLLRHLQRNPELGMVGPVTNNIGNESMIPLPKGSVDHTCFAGRRYNLDHAGELYPLQIAAFFCVMIPRNVHEIVGCLDEQFVPGFFEDDDYCLRIRKAGFQIACAEDVFVYHELSASFDQLALSNRAAIFDRNKALFEAKWGPWKPHQYRPAGARAIALKRERR
ncbi:MAG: glycosyltransferase [Betaproteobacteria bacterium]|nr:glycosyltransferase [Betaproteobacteria bacterium]NBT05269.1 glycosyltransferase [Betaproteobacteria bacterium]